MNQTLVVGIDPHRKKNVLQLMDSQGQELGSPLRVDNNQPGTVALVEQVVEQMRQGGYERLQLASEATGWYWFHLFQSLSQDPLLNQWPVELYLFNPRVTAKFKQSYGDQDKTDPLDAFVVADRLRFGRDLPVPFRPDDTYLPLRLLTRYYFHLSHSLAREKSYALAILYLKASDYTHPDKQPFANVFGAASQAVLQEFASIEQVAALPFDELVEFIDLKGKRRFADPADNARKLHQIAQDSYPLAAAFQRPVNTILSLCFKQIALLEAHQKRLQIAIADQLTTLPHSLTTIPGIGPIFAAGLIAEIGPLERFNFDQAKVAKFAGLVWRKSSSADFQAEDTPLIHNCNRYLRYYFCEAANAVRMHDAAYAAFYDRKFHEVRKHQHKRAIVLTARKLVRLVVRLLTTNQPYRPGGVNGLS
jgi:transposase